MYFILGYIVGLLTAILIFIILVYFKVSIEKRVKVLQTKLTELGPKSKGAIFMPEDENERIRRKHIEQNKADGRDTLLEELRNK